MSYPNKDKLNNMRTNKKGTHPSRNTSGNSVNHRNTPAQEPSVSELHNIQVSREATHAQPVQTPIVSPLPLRDETEKLYQRSSMSESTDVLGNGVDNTKQSGKSCAGCGSLSSSPCRKVKDSPLICKGEIPMAPIKPGGLIDDSCQLNQINTNEMLSRQCATVVICTSGNNMIQHEAVTSISDVTGTNIENIESTRSLDTSDNLPSNLSESSNVSSYCEEKWSVVMSRNKKRLDAAMLTLHSSATGKITSEIYLSRYKSIEFEVPFKKVKKSHMILLGFHKKDRIVYEWRCLAWARNYFLCPGHPKRTNVDLEIECDCPIIRGGKNKHPWTNLCAFDLDDSCESGTNCKRCHLYIPEVEANKVLIREAKAAKELKLEEAKLALKSDSVSTRRIKSKKPASHSVKHQEETKGRDKCKNFFGKGFCSFGTNCNFSHDSDKLNVTLLNSRAKIELRARIDSKNFHHHVLIERIHKTLTASLGDMHNQLDMYEAKLKPWAQHKNDRVYFHDIITGLEKGTLADSDRRRLSRFYLGVYDFALKCEECTNKFRLYDDELEQEIALVFIRSTKKMCPKFFEKLMKQWRIVENVVVPDGIENDSVIPKECICSEACTLGTHSFEECYNTDVISGEEASGMSISEHKAHLLTPAVLLLDSKMRESKELYDQCINQLYAARAAKKNMPKEQQQGETFKSYTTRVTLIDTKVTDLTKTRELLSTKLTKLYFERYCSVRYGYCLARDGGMSYVPYFNKPISVAKVITLDFDLTRAFPEGYGPGAMVLYNPVAVIAPFSKLANLPRRNKIVQTYDEYLGQKKVVKETKDTRKWMQTFSKVINQINHIISLPYLADMILTENMSFRDYESIKMLDYIERFNKNQKREKVATQIKQIVFVPFVPSQGKKIFQKNYIPDDIILIKMSFRDNKSVKMLDYIKHFNSNQKLEKQQQISRHNSKLKRQRRIEARKMRIIEHPEDFILNDRVLYLSPIVRELKLRFESELTGVRVSEQFALKLTRIIRSKQAQAKSEFIAELSKQNALIQEAKAKELAQQKIKAAELREAQMEECDDINDRRRECIAQNAYFVNKSVSDSEDSDSEDEVIPMKNEIKPTFNVFSRSVSRTKSWTYVLGINESKLKSVLRFFKLTLNCGGSVKNISTAEGKVKGIELQGVFVKEVNDYLTNKNTSREESEDSGDDEQADSYLTGLFQANQSKSLSEESDEEFDEESDEESDEAAMIRMAQIEKIRQEKIEAERLERVKADLALKAEAKRLEQQRKSEEAKTKKAQIEAKIQERQAERERLRIEALNVRPVVLSREERNIQIAEHRARRAEQLAKQQAEADKKAAAKLLIKGDTINTGKKSKANHTSSARARLERKNHLEDMEFFDREDDKFIHDTLA